MSTLELEMAHSMECDADCECYSPTRGLSPLSIHGDPRRAEIWKLMLVTEGQREESQLPDIGRPIIFCVDCDQVSEEWIGSLESFAENLFDTGWAVSSLDHNTAICQACANKTEDETWAEQYREGSGGLL